MGRVIPFKPYTHECRPGPWKRRGICPLCFEHKMKLEAHIAASRARGRHRRGIVKESNA